MATASRHRAIVPGVVAIALLLSLAAPLGARDSARDPEPAQPAAKTEARRLFGIVPNYRTSPSLAGYVGNSAAVAISNAISRLGSQLAADMAANILKEFRPEISRASSRQHGTSDETRPTAAGAAMR